MTGRARGVVAALQGCAAFAALVAAVIGLPILLYRLGGSPVPHQLPGWAEITGTLMRRDNGDVFLGAVRDISWIAWAAFSAGVVAEAQAAIRGRKAPRLKIGHLQNAAGWLVTLVALTFAGQPAVVLVTAPAAMAAVVSTTGAAATGAAAPPGREVTSMAFYQLVTVRSGECLWTIAEHYLGAGDRYPEIVRLNLGHQMGDGQVFRDPSDIWPGWVLQLPAHAHRGAGPAARRSGSRAGGDGVRRGADAHPGGHDARPGGHDAHPGGGEGFGRPHRAAGSPRPAAVGSGDPAAAPSGSPAPDFVTPGISPGASAETPPGREAHPPPDAARSDAARSDAARPAAGERAGPQARPEAEFPQAAVFGAGMLAGGAAVTLARLRHRQRQARRLGRRIALPASAPVIAAERRLHAASSTASPHGMPALPATALRAVLGDLSRSLVSAGQPIPEIAGLRITPSALELLLASPACEPPPDPFIVPGGRQGMTWSLPLTEGESPPSISLDDIGDLLPGLITAGLDDDDGYVLLNLEYLRVTTVSGPAALADQVLVSAAAELATSELAGWYYLVLVGFPEFEPVDGRAACCDGFEDALDLLAAKAVALRRVLDGEDHADIRARRLADPADEDWVLALLVSRIPPTGSQLAFLLDLASDPGGIAALVPDSPLGRGGPDAADTHPSPAGIQLAADPDEPGGIRARVVPLGLDARPRSLTQQDYQALCSLFATAADLRDVGPDEPPYDGSSWPPDLAGDSAVTETSPGNDPACDDGWDSAEPGPDQRPEWITAAGDPADLRSPAARPIGLRIGVLGGFTINGAPAALQPAQSQLILALALNQDDGLSNSQLRYLLGADPDHPKPSDSLRQLIVRTRRQLGRAPDGREWIEHLGAGQYALHPAARFDWADFDELAERGLRARDASYLRDAMGLIRGQPFIGCYHWWLDLALTETVRAQIVDAAEMLAELELAAGDVSASGRAARAGLAGDAGAEQLWRALMRAEHAAGNMSGVREAWRRCLDSIAEIAVDGEPHPDTAALYRQLTGGPRPQPAWRG